MVERTVRDDSTASPRDRVTKHIYRERTARPVFDLAGRVLYHYWLYDGQGGGGERDRPLAGLAADDRASPHQIGSLGRH